MKGVYFCKDFCKTHYASDFMSWNTLALEIIKYMLEGSIRVFGVGDESSYFHTRNYEDLAEYMTGYNKFIGEIGNKLKGTFNKDEVNCVSTIDSVKGDRDTLKFIDVYNNSYANLRNLQDNY